MIYEDHGNKKKADQNRAAFSVFTDFNIEQGFLQKGNALIAGVDEAGRGALAGPLCLGLVIYEKSIIDDCPGTLLGEIRDSKKISHRKRVENLKVIEEYSYYCSYTMVSHIIVDRYNVNGATCYALKKLLKTIPVKPDIVLMDGNFRFSLDVPVVPIVKGDQKSLSIASASIIAKVRRDAVLEKLSAIYPGYGLEQNKGYGTLLHRKAIERIGFSAIHRRSYEPVKSMVTDNK